MSSEKFLEKFFSRLKKEDFDSDTFLSAFYRFFKKAQTEKLFACYINYITRNREFIDDNDRAVAMQELYDDIKSAFMSDATGTQNTPGSTTLNRAKAMIVLSNFIKQSGIIVYNNPNEISTENDEKVKNAIQTNLLDEIVNIDKRTMPVPKPDANFSRMSNLMNIWRDTESKCNKLCEDASLELLLSKLFIIDTQQDKTSRCVTADIKEVNEILPIETFIPSYSLARYTTQVNILNVHPIDVAVDMSQRRIKTLYICTGSHMVQGGNADQGFDVQESMLYLTSTYSVGISKALHAYPLSINQVLLCPNVLVFKDNKYQDLPVHKYQRISVMCCFNKWRPALNPAESANLLDASVVFADATLYEKLCKILTDALETALFFGYDSVIIDDRSVFDNTAPAHLMAQLVKNAVNKFSGRFKDIIIAINKVDVFNVFKQYF